MKWFVYLFLMAAFLSTFVSRTAADDALGPWRATGKIKLPAVPNGASISDDHAQVLVMCTQKQPWFSGGANPGWIDVTTSYAFAADTGKQLFQKQLGQIGGQMSMHSRRLAMTDMSDKVTTYDIVSWRPISVVDCRSANDRPPGEDKGVPPELKDFGGGGRIDDIELAADGKTLVVIRMASGGWKLNAKKTAWTGESFEQVTFWDVDRGTKLATLDCEDKNAFNPSLSLLPCRNQMLVKFENGARLLDLSSRKWGVIFPLKDVFSVAASPDEKTLAVTDHDQNVKLFSMDSGKETLSFRERPINPQPRLNGGAMPGRFNFGPVVKFVEHGKCLRITLNDGKTVLYKDSASGKKMDRPPSENQSFPGGPVRVLTVSADGRCAVTAPLRSSLCTVWRRGMAGKSK